MGDRTLFVTGGDGFVGRSILRHFLTDDLTVVLLVLPKFLGRVRGMVESWRDDSSTVADLEIVTGDITQPDLGLRREDRRDLTEAVTDCLHLAAAYDLTIDRETGEAINVGGTRNVVGFLQSCRNLETFGYMSTTAISGDHESTFSETDYDVGQSFNNYYEESKFEAEGVVRSAMDDLPTIVFRPTTIVGNSRTGEIDKLDGPYYLIRTIDRNLHLVVPDTGEARFHIEPVDFVAEAVYSIFEHPEAPGNCYHLADPDPPTYREFIRMVCEYWEKPKPLLEVPPVLMRPLFSVPGAERLFGLPAEAFDYSCLNRQYGTAETEPLLEDVGVSCPPVETYLPAILDYYRNHLAVGETRDTRW